MNEILIKVSIPDTEENLALMYAGLLHGIKVDGHDRLNPDHNVVKFFISITEALGDMLPEATAARMRQLVDDALNDIHNDEFAAFANFLDVTKPTT